jgi:TonB family protein
MKLNSSQIISLSLHASLMIFFAIITQLNFREINKEKEFQDIPLVMKEKEVQVIPPKLEELKKITEPPIKSINNEKIKIDTPVKKVFGLSRDSLTDDQKSDADSSVNVNVKMGNTILKVEDDLILDEDDPTQIPAPTEEYLVETMPLLKKEVLPIYPNNAKDAKLEGRVELKLLIDEKGRVRKVEVLSGEEIFLEEAVRAIKQFEFQPARLNGKTVAVEIRYVLNFKLES